MNGFQTVAFGNWVWNNFPHKGWQHTCRHDKTRPTDWYAVENRDDDLFDIYLTIPIFASGKETTFEACIAENVEHGEIPFKVAEFVNQFILNSEPNVT